MENLNIYARLYDIKNIKKRLEEIYEYFQLHDCYLVKKQGNYLQVRKLEYH